MYNAGNQCFVPITPEVQRKMDDPDAPQALRLQRDWTRFAEGETVNVKGINFHIHEIGEKRLVLKPIDKHAFSERQVPQ